VEADADLDDEDLIERQDMVITVTHGGYVKRTPLVTYRTQHRGGKGRSGMSTKDEDAVTRVFSASTHTQVLFFSSGGKVYKMKVWRLPLGGPTSRGKAFINLFPIELGETMTSILPLPEEEERWTDLDVVFATRSGDVRRNRLTDFVQVNRNGKIAMKLAEGDGIIGVAVVSGGEDVLLTTKLGRCIRFSVDELRVFSGRGSTGVRGIRLAKGDVAISMAIVRAAPATSEERTAYLRRASAMRAAATGENESPSEAPEGEPEPGDEGVNSDEINLSLERFAELGAGEEFILTISSEGFGKRTSAYDYRRTGRGGQGLIAHDLSRRGGHLTASFPVEEGDEILLVTDQGQLIRVPVAQIRIAGRNTQGVTIFRTAAHEHVVSVERLEGASGEGGDDGEGEEPSAES
ncbi:MAG: DNA gyrase C-terminal beta-propeller domain-containing protein, partial [Caulobacteraceae bacterium]